jgi:hypothetical protein
LAEAPELGYIHRVQLRISDFGGAVMRTQLLLVAIVLPSFCFVHVQPAIAQAGSTGGTVGKRDKSVSGSEEPAKPEARPHHQLASEPAEGKSKLSGCGNVVGTYKWLVGTTTVIKSDGTTTNTDGNRGNWTCASGQVAIAWKNGQVDHLTPKPSGFSVLNTNSGVQFDGVRM